MSVELRLLASGYTQEQVASVMGTNTSETKDQTIARLTVERDRLLSCTGCERGPTDTKPHYDSGCMECRRFYGDLYEETSK